MKGEPMHSNSLPSFDADLTLSALSVHLSLNAQVPGLVVGQIEEHVLADWQGRYVFLFLGPQMAADTTGVKGESSFSQSIL